ncbi:zinc metalloproteinase nas-36-like isoform X1 [Pomacea canaliculata]|uniref:zinc metalloproteinase nas-36-like isoform X1 n=1 Tax=Pomacea canaliculata TaxID=400727 RepID=UPI000D73341C|nr:zinc metalloproteinase nas-36-like isoform X1 [Pomacea canaliculata]
MVYVLSLSFVVAVILQAHLMQTASLRKTRGERSPSASGGLPPKLQAITKWLEARPDANIFDYILETNRGMGLNLYEGDIRGFNPWHRSAVRTQEELWNARTVPYVVDSSVEPAVRDAIQEAIQEFHHRTCIHWVPRIDERDYVVFKKSSGCFSSIGRVGGPQEVSLMTPCAQKGTAMHEMLHVLGFFHEHSRPDRDQWVQILLQNVLAGKEGNFDRLSDNVIDTLGVLYDYESIMHYSRYAFSANGQATILPKQDPWANLGQRDDFSHRDIERLNILYHCESVGQTHSESSGQGGTSQPLTETAAPNGWSSWGSWSDCDLQCRHFRYRLCTNLDAAFCPGSTTETEACAHPCKTAVSLGCWANNPSSPAISSVEGLYPAVQDAYQFRAAAVRRCADVATTLGYDVFALSDGGKCLTSRDALHTFSSCGPSQLCDSSGKGGPAAMSVYSFNGDVDGGWSQWTEWGQCSRSCGGGQQYRYRRCNSPPPTGRGQPCQGHDAENTRCGNQVCEIVAKCGVRNHVGSVGSAGYIHVSDYDDFMTCDYVILSSLPDVTVSLEAVRMDIEPSVGCIYDYLAVYDGVNDTVGELMGRYCGTSPLFRLQSSGPAMFLRFLSDSTTTGGGYTLQFIINSGTRKACPPPFPLSHGTIVMETNFVGDTAAFACEPGYHLIGPSLVTCVDQPGMAAWTDNFPYCLYSRKRRSLLETAVNCTFEGNLCGFHHEGEGNWRWILQTGESLAPHQLQRPVSDRQGSKAGYFLYVESTPSWRPSDSARVTSPRYAADDTSPHCLEFWYYIYGNELVQLQVLQASEAGELLHWSSVGRRDGRWAQAKIRLRPLKFLQITFEAAIGLQLGASAAVDDVVIRNGLC